MRAYFDMEILNNILLGYNFYTSRVFVQIASYTSSNRIEYQFETMFDGERKNNIGS